MVRAYRIGHIAFAVLDGVWVMNANGTGQMKVSNRRGVIAGLHWLSVPAARSISSREPGCAGPGVGWATMFVEEDDEKGCDGRGNA